MLLLIVQIAHFAEMRHVEMDRVFLRMPRMCAKKCPNRSSSDKAIAKIKDAVFPSRGNLMD